MVLFPAPCFSSTPLFTITEAISGTDMYYDPIMNRIYSDKSIYYDDLSDDLSDE